MNQLKEWFSAAELAAMKLDGIPNSERRIRSHAQKNLWVNRTKVRGKGLEYQPPKSIMNLIQERILKTTLVTQKSSVTHHTARQEITLNTSVITIGGLTRRVKKDADLTDKDRTVRDSSLMLCRAIDAAVVASKCSVRKVIFELASRLISGHASNELIHAAHISYTKPRAGGQTEAALISRLNKMYAAYKQGSSIGDSAKFLVAGRREKQGHNPILVKAFLMHFCHPSRPPVMEAWKNSAAWFEHHGFERPSVDTFYRIEKELPITLKYRGRVTGSEWRSLLPYVKRDVSMFRSNDIWVGDGHSFKAKVAHPVHGRPYIPEVTLLRDWVSRKIVGWSIDLAESTIAVSAAMRHAMLTTRARPLVYYSDNGSGQTAKFLDCEVHGTLARLGIAHETGIPGNPQGRGIIERLWADTLIPLARSYPTYQGKSGDKESIRKMLVELNKKGGERLLPSFNQLVDDVEKEVQRYNSTPHSALGNKTPDQAYLEKLDQDSIDVGMTEEELNSLWMPEVERTPDRGVIRLFNNEYAMPDLVHLLAEGEQVRVRFDIHDADQVLVLRMDGRYIGTAQWDGHKRAAFPVPFIEAKREERVERKIAKKQDEIRLAKAELGNVIETDNLTSFVIPPQEKASKEVAFTAWPEKEKKTEKSFMETVAYLYGNKPEDDTPKNEAAAG